MTAVAWPSQMSLARALAEVADRPARWPGLGVRDAGPLRLIVVPDVVTMQRFAGGRAPTWGAGITLPSSRTILVRADAHDVVRTLRHELAHLVLRRAVTARTPRWFQEGYASHAAGEWSRLDGLALNLAVIRGRIPELEQLDSTLRSNASDAELSYALATAAVLELARRHPSQTLAPLLELLQDGTPWPDALRRTTGLTEGQFAAAWRKQMRQRYSVLTWFVAAGFWLLAAIAVIIAAAVRRRADEPRRLALDVGWDLPSPEQLEELDRLPEGE